MLEFGIRRGLAVKADYNQRMENDRYYYALKKRNEDEAKVKAKMYADDFDYMNAVNKFDNPIINEEAKKIIQETGAFVQANPGWESDVAKRMEYKRLVSKLKNNPNLNRGLSSDQSKKDWDQWRIKNPELANSPEGKAIEQQWMNYEKYGNQFGPGKEVSAFAFTPPELFDDEKYLQDIYQSLPTQERALSSKEFGKAVGFGATVSDVDYKRSYQVARGIVDDPRTGYKFAAKWQKLSESEKSYYHNDPREWIAKRGQAKTKRDLDAGQYVNGVHYQAGGGKEDAPYKSQYTIDIQESPRNQVRTSEAIPAISPLVKGLDGNSQYIGTGKLRFANIDANGQPIWKDLTVQGFTNLPSIETGRMVVGTEGQPWVEVETKVRVDNHAELSNPNFGLFTNTRGTGGFGFKEADEYVPLSGAEGIASIIPDEEGKPTEYYTIKHWVPGNTDQNNRVAYDKMSLGADFSKEARDPRMMQERQNQQLINVQKAKSIAQKIGGQLGEYNGQYAVQKADGKIYDLNGKLIQ